MTHHLLLLEYIRKAKEGGASDADIADHLQKAGWYRVDIRDALELFPKLTAAPMPAVGVSVPRALPHPQARSRKYDPYLIAVAVISFIVAFFGFVWLTSY